MIDGDPVRYSPLVSLLEDPGRIHEAVRSELQDIERLEGRLAALLIDPRVARRLRRETRRRERTSHMGRPVDAAATAPPAIRPGLRPPSKATVERHVALLDELPGLTYPTTPDHLARLQARLAGVPAPVPFRSVRATVRGSEQILECPRPDQVPDRLQQALQWGAEAEFHPVLASAILAGEVLAIRPFKDNDPLLSRLLMRMVLRNNGLGTAADIAMDARIDLGEPATLDRLVEAQVKRDVVPWLLHSTGLLRDALAETVTDAGFAARYAEGLNDRQWGLAEWFRRMQANSPEDGWRFRDIHAVFDNVPARTLKRDLATLRDVGLLTMDGKLKSSRYRWSAEEPDT